MLSNVSLILAAAFFGFSASAGYAVQMPLSVSEAESVPGVNNVTFCTVPRSEQVFHIDFFDIAPLPVPVDQIFFTYLRGWLPNNMTSLEDAKLQITISAELASGEQIAPVSYAIPLATYAADDVAHLTIRYRGGKFGGPLQPGVNEIVTDYWLPGMFIEAGNWTFKVEAIFPGKGKKEEDKYLFAFQMSQWLEP